MARTIRLQFWAEARARIQSGEAWHITDPELIDAERSEQDARFRSDPWEQSVAEWLAKPTDLGSRAIRGVTTTDVLSALGLDISKRDNGHSARVGSILRRLGWVPGKNVESRDGARVRVYRPVDGAATNGATLVPLEVPPDAFIEPASGEDLFPPKAREAE
jgi:predicted P-loop ATPase